SSPASRYRSMAARWSRSAEWPASARRENADEAERQQDEAGQLARAQPFAKKSLRHDVAEVQLDEAERADIGDRLHRHRGEPAGRAERAHRTGQQRHPPGAQHLDDDGPLAP